jgi:hypothetical protein
VSGAPMNTFIDEVSIQWKSEREELVDLDTGIKIHKTGC